VREGEELDVRVEAVGEKGDGIARKDGFVLFVPNTKAGDEIRIRVTKVLAKVGFAEKVGEATMKPSVAPQRVEQKREDPHANFEAHEELDSEEFGEEAPATEEPKE